MRQCEVKGTQASAISNTTIDLKFRKARTLALLGAKRKRFQESLPDPDSGR